MTHSYHLDCVTNFYHNKMYPAISPSTSNPVFRRYEYRRIGETTESCLCHHFGVFFLSHFSVTKRTIKFFLCFIDYFSECFWCSTSPSVSRFSRSDACLCFASQFIGGNCCHDRQTCCKSRFRCKFLFIFQIKVHRIRSKCIVLYQLGIRLGRKDKGARVEQFFLGLRHHTSACRTIGSAMGRKSVVALVNDFVRLADIIDAMVCISRWLEGNLILFLSLQAERDLLLFLSYFLIDMNLIFFFALKWTACLCFTIDARFMPRRYFSIDTHIVIEMGASVWACTTCNLLLFWFAIRHRRHVIDKWNFSVVIHGLAKHFLYFRMFSWIMGCLMVVLWKQFSGWL